MLDVKLNQEDVRGRLAFQAGDSVKANYSAEQDQSWRYVQEATLGTKLTKRLWLDGGIYLAHVGFESFNSRDNWNYTRSLVAEYSPYYESGAKLGYQASDRLSFQFHLLNGWQNISNSSDPLYGLQVNYKPNSATQLTYANILGEQDSGFRTFHDFIFKQDISDKFSLAIQFDFGTQELSDDSTSMWHGWALLAKRKLTPKLSLGGRIERFYDPDQVLVPTLSSKSFNVTALSINVDYEILKNFLWRSEYRIFLADEDVFPTDSADDFFSDDSLIVTSLSYAFDTGGLS